MSSFPHLKGKDGITVSIDAIVAAGGKRGSTFFDIRLAFACPFPARLACISCVSESTPRLI
jgi:hypothetical protein